MLFLLVQASENPVQTDHLFVSAGKKKQKPVIHCKSFAFYMMIKVKMRVWEYLDARLHHRPMNHEEKISQT